MLVRGTIDLNADLGEGMPGEPAILELISTANLAGGGHAGGGHVLEESVRWCRERGVAVGAHPSYPDRENFGRVSWLGRSDAQALIDSIAEQILAVQSAWGTLLHHVKAHGALYNDAVLDERAARLILQAMDTANVAVPILTMDHGVLARLAREEGREVIAEIFADRAYAADGTLVPRTDAGAVLASVEQIVARMLRFLDTGRIQSSTGEQILINATSICIHGDNRHAVEVARALHAALLHAGCVIRSP